MSVFFFFFFFFCFYYKNLSSSRRWAVGVLIFEMRCGHSPFESKSQMEMFKKITKRDLVLPKEFEPELQSLIDGLLQVGCGHFLSFFVALCYYLVILLMLYFSFQVRVFVRLFLSLPLSLLFP